VLHLARLIVPLAEVETRRTSSRTERTPFHACTSVPIRKADVNGIFWPLIDSDVPVTPVTEPRNASSGPRCASNGADRIEKNLSAVERTVTTLEREEAAIRERMLVA
jgi:hypothetical protein